MMNKEFFNFHFWRSFFYILGGFIIFSILFYFRIIRIRVPRDLYTNINWILIIIYVCMIVLFMYLIIKNIIKIINGPEKSNPITNEYFITMISYINVFSKFFYDCLEIFDAFLKKVMFGENYPLILTKICEFISNNIKFSYRRYFSWIFLFFPRLIISVVFFIDVVYFNYMEYFYKVLPLVLITLIYQYILYTVQTFCEGNFMYYLDYLSYYEYKENKSKLELISNAQYYAYKFKEAQEYKNSELLFQKDYLLSTNLENFQVSFSRQTMEEEQKYFMYSSKEEINERLVTMYLDLHKWIIYPETFILSLKVFKDDIDGPKVKLFTSIIYLLSWSYMLLYGILNFT